MTDTPNLKERLLSAAHVDPTLKDQYEDELQAIIHRRLRPGEKWFYGGFAVVLTVCAVLFGIGAFVSQWGVFVRSIVAIGAIHGLVNAIRIAIVLRRGQMDRRKSTKWYIGAVYFLVVFLIWLMGAMNAGQPGASTDFLMIMAVPIVTAILVFCTGWVCNVIAQAEIRTREEMLEMKLQLAAMAKELKRNDGP